MTQNSRVMAACEAALNYKRVLMQNRINGDTVAVFVRGFNEGCAFMDMEMMKLQVEIEQLRKQLREQTPDGRSSAG